MYSILKLQEHRSLTLWEKIEQWFGDKTDPRVFIEILYDPLSNYLIYRDQNKEQQLKKDLIRALFLFADIRDRSAVFGLKLQVVTNRILDFLTLAQRAKLKDDLILGAETLSDQHISLILTEYFTDPQELKQVKALISRILSDNVILQNI